MKLEDLTKEQLQGLVDKGSEYLEAMKAGTPGETKVILDGPEMKKPDELTAIDLDAALTREPETVLRSTKQKDDELKNFSITKGVQFILTGQRKGNELEADWIRSRDGFAPSTNKDMTLYSDIAGGFLVPTVVINELIDLLKAETIMRRAGATILTSNAKTVQVPRKTGSTSAYWVADEITTDITKSAPTFGDLNLTLRNLAARVQVARNLIKYASLSVETLIRQDIIEQMALTEDLAFLQGTGGTQPVGLKNWPGVNSTSSIGAPNFDDLLACLTTLKARNVRVSEKQTSWWMHPNVLGYLQKHKTGTGQYDYVIDLTQRPPDRILGLPVYTSSQIPITLGAGSETYMVCGNANTYAIAQGGGIEILVDPYTLSAQLKIQIVAVFEVDGGPRRIDEFQVLTGVTY